MEKQIREIIAYHCGGTYEGKQKATEEILNLFNVSKRYSLDYFDKENKALNLKVWAKSEQEALDKLGEKEPKAIYIFISKI